MSVAYKPWCLELEEFCLRLFQVIDFTAENFFCLMDDTGETRDDLKFTELCTPSKVDDIRTMVANAEENGQDVIVSMPKLHAATFVVATNHGWGDCRINPFVLPISETEYANKICPKKSYSFSGINILLQPLRDRMHSRNSSTVNLAYVVFKWTEVFCPSYAKIRLSRRSSEPTIVVECAHCISINIAFLCA